MLYTYSTLTDDVCTGQPTLTDDVCTGQSSLNLPDEKSVKKQMTAKTIPVFKSILLRTQSSLPMELTGLSV